MYGERYEELTIGSIGFVQYGAEDYFQKRQIERTVIREIVSEDPAFKIPEEFQGMCRFKIVKCPYEDGSYDELQLLYDWRMLSHNGEDFEDRFWQWAGELEDFDFEKEEYIDKCYALLNAEDNKEFHASDEEAVLIPQASH